MSKHLHFSILGVAIPQGRPRFTSRGGYPRAYDPPRSREYKQRVFHAFLDALNSENPNELSKNSDELQEIRTQHTNREPLFSRNPLKITIMEYRQIPKTWSNKKKSEALRGATYPITRPDLDNVLKTILDALNGYAWYDDSQIVRVEMSKIYDENPHVEIEIAEVEAGESH